VSIWEFFSFLKGHYHEERASDEQRWDFQGHQRKTAQWSKIFPVKEAMVLGKKLFHQLKS
jgi:hypothetical protein